MAKTSIVSCPGDVKADRMLVSLVLWVLWVCWIRIGCHWSEESRVRGGDSPKEVC